MSLARGLVVFLSINMTLLAADGSRRLPIPASNPGEQWTVERAIQRALEANPDFLARKAEYERQQGVRIQVRARMLPQLGLNASVDEKSESSIDRPPADFNLPPDKRSALATSGYDARVTLQQLVFDGLESWHRVKQSKATENQARFLVAAAAHQTVALVRQAFDGVLWRRDALEAERQRVSALQQIVQWTERKQAVGEIAEFEMFRAKAELKLAEAALAEASSNVAKAEQTFRRILVISDGGGSGGDLTLVGTLQPRTLPWTLAEAVAMARSRRPDLSASMAALNAAQFGVRAAYGGYLPRIEASGSYGAWSSYYDENRELDGWSAAIVARWDIFDGFANRGRVRAEMANRRTAEVRLAELQFQIDSQLRELYAGLELARSAVEAQRSAADLGGRSLAQARRLHQIGQIGVEPVLQAEMTNRQAQLGLLEAIYRHNAAVAQIEYSVGDGFEADELLGDKG